MVQSIWRLAVSGGDPIKQASRVTSRASSLKPILARPPLSSWRRNRPAPDPTLGRGLAYVIGSSKHKDARILFLA